MPAKNPADSAVPAAIYARYSSHNQDEGLSIEAQMRAIQNFLKTSPYKIVRTWKDEAVSGMSALKRDAFQEMLQEALGPSCSFKAIIVAKWDRFARNTEEAVTTKNLLRRRGIQAISVMESPGGKSDPASIFIERIHDVHAEYESLQIAVRTLGGLQEAARRGWNVGYPPLGYKIVRFMTPDKGEKSRLEIQESEAQIVKRIFDLFLSGLGASAIRNKLNVEGVRQRGGRSFTTMNVLGILRNAKYVGRTVFGSVQNKKKHPLDWAYEKIVVENTHAPIIELKKWEAVQKMLETRKQEAHERRPILRESDHLFTGLISCMCGAAMVGQRGTGRWKKQWRYYVCNKVNRGGRGACTQKRLPAERLEESILDRLRAALTDKENLKAIIQAYNTDVEKHQKGRAKTLGRLNTEIQDVDRRRRNLIQAIEDGTVTGVNVNERLEELAALKQKKELELIDLNKRLENKPLRPREEAMAAWEEHYSALFAERGSLLHRKAFVQSLVIGIRVEPEEVVVTYTPALNRPVETVSFVPPSSGFAPKKSGVRDFTLCEPLLAAAGEPQTLRVRLVEIIPRLASVVQREAV